MTKQTTPGFARRYWTRALWIAALIACLAQTAMLSREVQRGLDRLSTAPIDDVRWTLSQTEVELLRMLLAVKEVSTPARGHRWTACARPAAGSTSSTAG